MTSNELIQRYLLGLTTEEEVRELEACLANNEKLQGELLLQAELDAHLRQEVQLTGQQREEPEAGHPRLPSPSSPSSTTFWKWASGLSTLAASILLGALVLNYVAPEAAWAYPSLGHVTVNVPSTEQNIWAAAGRGDLPVIRKELLKNIPVDSRCDDGLTPLHIATLFHRQEAVELLLAAGADMSLGDAEGNLPLQMAAFLGYTDLVRSLLAAGADPAVRNQRGFNAMDLVSVTWSDGLESFYRSVEKELGMPLNLSRIQLERPKILMLLKAAAPKAGFSVPTVSIWQAAITGNTAVIEQHAAAGTDLNANEDFGGNTPLHLAAIFGQLDAEKLLIQAGANLNSQNNMGGTPLHMACYFCRPEIVELLLKSGADPKRVNSHGMTPLASVKIELNAESRAIYEHVFSSTGLKCDLDEISRTRLQIAEILQKHEHQPEQNN